MFAVDRVNLHNFRAFVGDHSFFFPTEPGLYHVTGENLKHPRLGPNGIGKSTLLDAIFWCLYGRTTRGLKANDVVSWGKKDCRVDLWLTVGRDVFEIQRCQSPNKLLLNGKPVEQEVIVKAVRLSADAFTCAVLVPQFGDSFFDLKPEAKLALFTQIMDLDYWLDRSRDAAELVKDIEEQGAAVNREIATIEGRLGSIKADIADLRTKEMIFDESRIVAIKQYEAALKNLTAESPKAAKQLRLAKEALRGAEQRAAATANKIDEADQAYYTVTSGLGDLIRKEEGLKATVGAGRDVIKRLTAVSSTCPMCFQKVDKTHMRAHLKKAEMAVDSAEDALHIVSVEIERINERAEETHQHKKGLEIDLKAIEQNHDDFEREVRQLEDRAGTVAVRFDAVKHQLETEIHKNNPFTQLLLTKRNDALESGIKKAMLTKKLDGMGAELAAVSYWVGGFKRLRLMLVEETLRSLEIEINNNLGSLGLTDWQINLDVERENKSGGVTKGFSVFVRSPDHPDPVRYEAWSGGETQRLRMAGDLGLANLIMQRAGLENTIEFYDEPSHHLTTEGLLDLAETLAQRAEDSKRVILFVDHHVIEFGGFSGTIELIKDAAGSRIKARPGG